MIYVIIYIIYMSLLITLHACAYIVRGDYRAVYVIVYECTSSCFYFYYNENCLAYTVQ